MQLYDVMSYHLEQDSKNPKVYIRVYDIVKSKVSFQVAKKERLDYKKFANIIPHVDFAKDDRPEKVVRIKVTKPYIHHKHVRV